MVVRLVALDIDGTLVHSGSTYPVPRLAAAIRALEAVGIAVVLASGRMFPGTLAMAQHLGLTTPLICQQGCAVYLHDGTILRELTLDHDLAMAVVAHARLLGHTYEWFNSSRYIISRPHPDAVEYGRVSGILPEYHEAPEHSGVRPTGVGIISSNEEAAAIHRHLTATYGDRMFVLDFPNAACAVASNANKGHALSLVCADLGIEQHEVLAVGDGINDATMLRWAGRGVAMAHSDRHALAAADEVLSTDDDALAVLLESLPAPPPPGSRRD